MTEINPITPTGSPLPTSETVSSPTSTDVPSPLTEATPAETLTAPTTTSPDFDKRVAIHVGTGEVKSIPEVSRLPLEPVTPAAAETTTVIEQQPVTPLPNPGVTVSPGQMIDSPPLQHPIAQAEVPTVPVDIGVTAQLPTQPQQEQNRLFRWFNKLRGQ